jgi:hypothetical protein
MSQEQIEGARAMCRCCGRAALGSVGTHVLDHVRAWYAAGLLRPAIWVLPEVFSSPTAGPRE